MNKVSEKVVGRLTLYRRLLNEIAAEGTENVFSHELAARAKCTPAQVRRDLMSMSYSGSPVHGYTVRDLVAALNAFLDAPARQKVALVGVGNLGRALLAYFVERHPQFTIAAAFDCDMRKVDRITNGCPIYPASDLEQVLREEDIRIAVLAVPADVAQETALRLAKAGIKGVLNFAPVRLWVPAGVYLENLDMTMSLERVAFYARADLRQQKV